MIKPYATAHRAAPCAPHPPHGGALDLDRVRTQSLLCLDRKPQPTRGPMSSHVLPHSLHVDTHRLIMIDYDRCRPVDPNARPLTQCPHLYAPGPHVPQSSTRYVSTNRRRRLLMVPLFDMANHARECPHHISGYDQGDWFHLIAGEDVEAGEEVRACTGDA